VRDQIGVFLLGMLIGGLILAGALALGGVLELPTPVWVQILLCFGMSGAFGGILASMQLANLPDLLRSAQADHWSLPRIFNVALALVISAFGGIGGASAALFVMLLDGKIKQNLDDISRLTYVTSGLLAGFVGFQLLKRVAEGFAQALNAAKDVAGKEASRIVEPLQKRAELFEAITEGMVALQNKESVRKETIQEAIARLESIRKDFPENRRAAILLGRLYRHCMNDLQRAVEVLSDAKRGMDEKQNTKPDDEAAVLFNRACYNCLLSNNATTPLEKEELKNKGYADLELACKISPQNASQAATDADFGCIREEEKFRQLMAKYGVNLT
jgi:tetratricopeptide (TPR) repeat protein